MGAFRSSPAPTIIPFRIIFQFRRAGSEQPQRPAAARPRINPEAVSKLGGGIAFDGYFNDDRRERDRERDRGHTLWTAGSGTGDTPFGPPAPETR